MSYPNEKEIPEDAMLVLNQLFDYYVKLGENIALENLEKYFRGLASTAFENHFDEKAMELRDIADDMQKRSKKQYKEEVLANREKMCEIPMSIIAEVATWDEKTLKALLNVDFPELYNEENDG